MQKNLKIVKNKEKMPKIAQKCKNIFKNMWKILKLAQLWKISTGGATAATDFF